MSVIKECHGFCDSGLSDCPFEGEAATSTYSTVGKVRDHMHSSGWKKIRGLDHCNFCVETVEMCREP